MTSTLDAALRSWPAAPGLLALLLAGGLLYFLGWRDLHRRAPRRWGRGRLAAFATGLALLYLALASPIEPFSALLLAVHMVQHVLLLMVVPPLIWLAWPLFPMLRGLPEPIRVYWAAPLLQSRLLRRIFNWLTRPAIALPLFAGVAWLWHWPPAFQLALRSPEWHLAEHCCFLGAGMLFWFPIVGPYPSQSAGPRWVVLPYLFLADVQNTVLAALLTFAHSPIYQYYANAPRIGGISVLADQQTAGAIMWVPGSIVYLAPMFLIGVRLLYGERLGRPPLMGARSRHVVLNPCRLAAPRFDLLLVPWLGKFLRWKHARVALQAPMFGLAMLLIADGLRGPRVAAMNLAGVLPWIHWRGLLILSILVAGNVFCMACPFMLPRAAAKRFFPARWSLPRMMRNKWLAVALLILFLWAYEAFALWDSPWLTAWIAVAYFVAALVIDGFFQGAAFCKYVCPIGQFNFVQSLVSPLEVKVRQPMVCASCATKECIRGSSIATGCELHLYVPRKSSNMDCTFCLDCVRACPHENVGILAWPLGKELWRDPLRSGVGRFSRRTDLAALVVVLVFGAFANAAGMIGPVVGLEGAIQARLRLDSPLAIVSIYYAVAIILAPLVLVAAAARASRRFASPGESVISLATRFSFALVPIGFAMWMAHYLFHFLGSFDTALPVVQRIAGDLGVGLFGSPQWSCSCCQPVADWLPRLEILILDFGLLLSLYTAVRIAKTHSREWIRAAMPWCLLIALLFAAGVWIVLQPMQMRGTMPGG